MDLGIIRGSGTVILLACFVVLCFWAWSPAQKRRFEEASMLPFLDEDKVPDAPVHRSVR